MNLNKITKHIITDLAEYDVTIEIRPTIISFEIEDKLNTCHGGVYKCVHNINNNKGIVDHIKDAVSDYEGVYYRKLEHIIEWDGDMRLKRWGKSMNKYKKLSSIMEKYQDDFMKSILGDYLDEYGKPYASVYKDEWKGMIDSFVNYTYKNCMELIHGEMIIPQLMTTHMCLEALSICDFDDDFNYDKLAKWCDLVCKEYNEQLV